MTYHIQSGNIMIGVDDEAELRIVLGLLGVKVVQQLPFASERATSNGTQAPDMTVAERMKLLLRSLNKTQRQVLEALSDNDWTQDQVLRRKLGHTKKASLPGLWTGIVRNIRKCGLTTDQVFIKQHRNSGGPDDGYWYKMHSDFKAVMNQR